MTLLASIKVTNWTGKFFLQDSIVAVKILDAIIRIGIITVVLILAEIIVIIASFILIMAVLVVIVTDRPFPALDSFLEIAPDVVRIKDFLLASLCKPRSLTMTLMSRSWITNLLDKAAPLRHSPRSNAGTSGSWPCWDGNHPPCPGIYCHQVLDRHLDRGSSGC